MSELMWVAGLLEGEGSFGCYGDRKRPLVCIGMNDLDVVESFAGWFNANFPPHGAHERPARVTVRPPRGGSNRAYIVQIRSRRALQLMSLLRPYMGTRRQAKIDEVFECMAG